MAQGRATVFLRAVERRPKITTDGKIDKVNPEHQERMSGLSNGVPPNGAAPPRCPRRVVLLCDGEQSAVERVLLEYHGVEVSGKRLHADVQRLAGENPGHIVAAEWLGPLGWMRFLWCRAPSDGKPSLP